MTHGEQRFETSISARKSSEEEFEAAQVLADLQTRRAVQQRRFYAKAPKKLGSVVARVMQSKGYAQIRTTAAHDDAWRQVAGEELSQNSEVQGIRRGVFEVLVGNSLIAQELTFRKETLLTSLQQALPDARIKQLRFRVGQIKTSST